ncbi:MAG: threo-3-hydroxy-L-aspartate ammonia-lyase [Chloroflexi bacterium]|nr:threo-3-hydroxy-L-aspartate ammonia-lyase [Chloroflexota bacterium]
MTVNLDTVQAAAQRLRGHARRTPLMTSRTLDAQAGAQVFLKCENLQRMGAFKFRGAYNAISQLSAAQKAAGVLTFSSGNHAQAVALTGQLLGVQTTIVMPANAPVTKRAATEGYGGKVVLYDPQTQDREAVARALAAAHSYTMIPPYDHEQVIAGQGTAALEVYEELQTLDMLLVPVGGGGLISGSAIASKGLCPACKVIGVEPEVANDAYLSLRSKTLHTVKNPPTIADGTRTPSLGNITFPLVLRYVDDICTVSEDAIKAAVRFLFYRLKIVVEPSGALGVAALLSGAVAARGRVGVILSGGNIDAATMTAILAE